MCVCERGFGGHHKDAHGCSYNTPSHGCLTAVLWSPIGQYFASTMVIVGMSVVATVIVLQYHHHDPNTGNMPQWVRVCLCLSVCLSFCRSFCLPAIISVCLQVYLLSVGLSVYECMNPGTSSTSVTVWISSLFSSVLCGFALFTEMNCCLKPGCLCLCSVGGCAWVGVRGWECVGGCAWVGDRKSTRLNSSHL